MDFWKIAEKTGRLKAVLHALELIDTTVDAKPDCIEEAGEVTALIIVAQEMLKDLENSLTELEKAARWI